MHSFYQMISGLQKTFGTKGRAGVRAKHVRKDWIIYVRSAVQSHLIPGTVVAFSYIFSFNPFWMKSVCKPRDDQKRKALSEPSFSERAYGWWCALHARTQHNWEKMWTSFLKSCLWMTSLHRHRHENEWKWRNGMVAVLNSVVPCMHNSIFGPQIRWQTKIMFRKTKQELLFLLLLIAYAYLNVRWFQVVYIKSCIKVCLLDSWSVWSILFFIYNAQIPNQNMTTEVRANYCQRTGILKC